MILNIIEKNIPKNLRFHTRYATSSDSYIITLFYRKRKQQFEVSLPANEEYIIFCIKTCILYKLATSKWGSREVVRV